MGTCLNLRLLLQGQGHGASRKKDSDVLNMTTKTHTLALSNGVNIPQFGFGCAFGDWSSGSFDGKAALFPEQAWAAIPKALNAGLRHFDTAFVYRTHKPIGTSLGLAFRDGLVTRDEVFVTTK